jgi:hypothetical protein
MVRWNNPELYARCLTGAIDGTIWDTHPYTGTLQVRSCSSVNMTGEDEPWRLDIDAAEVMMSHVGGIQLAGNQSVLLRFAGVALESDTEYATFKLRNKITEYVWPEATS